MPTCTFSNRKCASCVRDVNYCRPSTDVPSGTLWVSKRGGAQFGPENRLRPTLPVARRSRYRNDILFHARRLFAQFNNTPCARARLFVNKHRRRVGGYIIASRTFPGRFTTENELKALGIHYTTVFFVSYNFRAPTSTREQAAGGGL